VTLGVDPHKASHTVAATDQVGRQLTYATTRGTRTSDHQELIAWARQRWPERTWSPSGPGSRTGCAGICMTWIPSVRPCCPPGTWSSGGS
jgi:hypothetical protein